MAAPKSNQAGVSTGAATPDTGVGGPTVSDISMENQNVPQPQAQMVVEQYVPAEILSALGDAEGEIAAADTEAVGSLLPNLAGTFAEIDAAASQINLALAEMFGQIGLTLNAATTPVLQLVSKATEAVSDAVIDIMVPIAQAGVILPEDADAMRARLDADPMDWLPAAIPALGALFASNEPTDCDVRLDPKCGAAGDDTSVGTGGGDTLPPPPEPPPPEPPPPTVPGASLCGVGEAVYYDRNPIGGFPTAIPGVYGHCYTPAVPIPPPVPPPPEPPPPPPPIFPPPVSPECCVSPVTTTGPVTIVMPPPPPTGPPAPPPTATCPPTTVVVPPITVTVPPPPPPPPSAGPLDSLIGVKPVSGSIRGIDWSLAYPCAGGFSGVIVAPAGSGPAAGAVEAGIVGRFIYDAGYLAASILSPTTLGFVERLSGDLPAATAGVIDSVFTYNTGMELAGGVLAQFGIFPGTSLGDVMPLLAVEGAAHWAERQTGVQVGYYATGVRYALQYISPQYIPSQPALDQLFNTGRLNSAQWECFTRANGNLPGWADKVRAMGEGRPNPHDLVTLLNRGYLTKDQYDERMIDIGWNRQLYRDDAQRLSEEYPGLPDQLRFMVRDSFDEDIVKKYGYDNDFDAKFNAEAQKLAKATNIPERFFRLSWRAHWQIPSYTQLSDVVHRFRPDRPDRILWEKDNPQNFGESDWDYQHRGPLVITVSNMQEAMEVNDMAPSWVAPLIGIAYRPITNTDAVRAFQVGMYNTDELYHSFRDNGYDSDNASKLALFYQYNTERMQSTQTGVLTVRKIIALYQSLSIRRDEAFNLLGPTTPDLDRRNQILNNVDMQMAKDQIQDIIKLTRKDFMYGKMSVDEAIKFLDDNGADSARTVEVVGRWAVQRRLRSKEATARQLCQWFAHKLISPDDYLNRLENLGYDVDDAVRIAGVCKTDADLAAFKAARSESDRAARLARQALQDAEKRLRQTIKDLTDQKNGLLAQIQKLQDQLSGQSPPPPPPPPPKP